MNRQIIHRTSFLRSFCAVLVVWHCVALYGCTRAGKPVEALWCGVGIAMGVAGVRVKPLTRSKP